MNRKLQQDVYTRIVRDLDLLKKGITATQIIIVLVLVFQGILTLILLKQLS